MRLRGTDEILCEIFPGKDFSFYPSHPFNINTWYHIVFLRDSGNLKLYVNGVLESVVPISVSILDVDAPFQLGRMSWGGGYINLNAYIDEFRVSKGIARTSDPDDPLYYSGSCSVGQQCFTPPNEPYGVSSESGTLPNYSSFSGNLETTNFSAESNLSAVSNPVLVDNNNKGKIEFFGTVDVNGANLDDAITISDNFVSVDSSMLPTFNKPANITFKTVSYPSIFSYNVLKNGEICSDCVKYSANPVKFKVNGFSNYTTNSTGVVPEFSSLVLFLISLQALILVLMPRHRTK